MYIVVTGAAGFIGSNLVKALNARGETQILAVDNLRNARQVPQSRRLRHRRLLRQGRVPDALADGDFDDDITAVLHQGACSDTMETDGRYMLANNYRYSVTPARALPGQRRAVPVRVLSASVYGAGPAFREERACEAPLNVYGYSKFLFDQYVRRMLPERTAQIAGFRYFNVYGPREAHKGGMASVVWHFFNQYRDTGKVQLFEGSGGYAAGEQRRDFVSVEDVVAGQSRLSRPSRAIGHLQPGHRPLRPFNTVAAATINACRAADGKPALAFGDLHRAGAIEYVGLPPARGQVPEFHQADLTRLRAAGYSEPMQASRKASPRCVRTPRREVCQPVVPPPRSGVGAGSRRAVRARTCRSCGKAFDLFRGRRRD